MKNMMVAADHREECIYMMVIDPAVEDEGDMPEVTWFETEGDAMDAARRELENIDATEHVIYVAKLLSKSI